MRDVIPYPIQLVPVFGALVLSCFVAWLSSSRLVSVYSSDIDFVVMSSYEKCEEPYNNRCVRHYVVQDAVTGRQHDLVPFDGQFPVSPLHDGIHIRKKGRGFIYEIDGEQQEWQGLAVNYWLLLGSLLIIGLWFYLGGVSFVMECIKRNRELMDRRLYFD